MAQKHFYKHKISNLLNIQKIVTIHYQELSRGYVAEEEKHDFWEIVYTDKESVTVVTENVSHTLSQGKMTFLHPNYSHYIACESEEANIFIISFECRSESMNYFTDRIITLPERYRVLLQEIMSEATATFRIPEFDPSLNKLELLSSPNLGGEQAIKNLLELLLIYLLRNEMTKHSDQRFFVSKIESSSELQDAIVHTLTKQLYNRFSLDQLCMELHYGKTRLCTFFKQATGQSIYQTYLKLKTEEAKKLIRRNHSFNEITELLCFDSLPHFISTFKHYTGMTPKEYRKSIRQ